MGQIKFHFKRGGSVKIEAIGFPEGQCHAATKPYEDVLAGARVVHEKTPDAVAAEADSVTTTNQNQRAS